MNVGPEIEKLHREQFGGAHQLFYFVDSLEKESYFYVNRNNHLRQKCTGFDLSVILYSDYSSVMDFCEKMCETTRNC